MRVAERTAELASLLAVSREINSTLEIDKILDIIMEHLERTIHYTGCGIFMLQGELLTLVAYRGPLSPADVVQSQATLAQSPLLQEAVMQRGPLIVADMDAESEVASRWRATAGALQRHLLNGSRSWLGVPLMVKGQLLAVLRLDHREPRFFTQYHADLAFTLANQAAVAIENARLYAHAQSVAAIEERQRLARELHDTVAQTFYSISLSTHAAMAQFARDPERAHRHMEHVIELAGAGLTEMKALIFDPQAESIRTHGLVAALERQLNAMKARNDIRVDAELGVEPDVPLKVKEAAYGIVREALQNVVRHAGASSLSVKLQNEGERLRIEVRDDGVGFEPNGLDRETFGLRSMRERTALVNGRIEVVSRPREGTLIRVEIPLAGDALPER